MMTPEQINAAVLGYAEQLDPALAEKLGAPPMKANGGTGQNGHAAAPRREPANRKKNRPPPRLQATIAREFGLTDASFRR
jgi:hypothetical protein